MSYPLSKRDQEYAIIDASRYLQEMKREALTTIVPHPDEKDQRIDLITVLSGRRPNLYSLLTASVEQDGWIALSHAQQPDLSSGLDAIQFIRLHAPSLDGKRSNQVVEIAKSEAAPVSQSILDVLKRGRNK